MTGQRGDERGHFRRTMDRRTVVAAMLALPLLRSSRTVAQTPGRLRAVATFSILADLVRQVGGDRVEVASLVGPNGDAHVFNPSPADAKKLTDAGIVFVNGLGLEGWIDRLIKASGTKAPIITATKGVQPIEGEAEEGHAPGHHSDPHAWQSLANVRLYVANIRDGLAAADPAGKDAYAANATSYLAQLGTLESEVKAGVASIPAARRRIITTHDAFGYFAKAYGMQFIAPQGVSTEAEANAKDVAKIIRQIRKEKIPAVFLENISDTRLIERIAKESGAKIGGKVYSDALSEPDGPAGTYVAMIRNNLRQFTEALK